MNERIKLDITLLLIILAFLALIMGLSIEDMKLTTNIWSFLIPAIVLSKFYDTFIKHKTNKPKTIKKIVSEYKENEDDKE